MQKFEYLKPLSEEEAISLLEKYGASAKALLGGTDLAVMIDDEMVTPKVVIDLKGISNLMRLELRGEYLYIGAGITFNELIASKIVKDHFPLLWETSRSVGSFGIRNRATLVGNICSAVPSADSAPALLVLNSSVEIRAKEGVREVPIDKFFVGPRKTVIQTGEIVTGIKIPLERGETGASYIKLGRYDGEDLAQVGVASYVNSDKVYRIAFGAVAPIPVRAYEAEEYLKGKDVDEDLIEEVKPIALKAISPISDVRASKEYRLYVSGVLLKRSLFASSRRLKKLGPAYGEHLV